MRQSPSSVSRSLARAGLALALTVGVSATATAQTGQSAPQDDPPISDRPSEPEGFVHEPVTLERVVLFADRYLGSGGGSNGFYVNSRSPITGAGFVTIGPGYRRWYKDDRAVIDGFGGVSWRGYKVAQAKVELPKLLRSRLTFGTLYRYQDFRLVKFFGEGPDTAAADESQYHLRSHNVVVYTLIRPARWFSVGTQLGWLRPSIHTAPGDEPPYVHTEVSITADGRDFPNHPTRGGFVRLSAGTFRDGSSSASSFNRYESEVAGFVPVAGSRVVLALHGWLAASDAEAGQRVPFYLLPSLGGGRSLRSYADFRFHDRQMVVANAELRVALMTHMDAVVFADAGSVAARVGSLDLDKRSYGAGLRLHTRRDTFARVDAAHGREGWRATMSLSEPFHLARTSRKTAPTPFVP